LGIAAGQGSARLKILLVAPGIYPARGGVELHVFRIAQGLVSRGDSVAVATAFGNTSEESRDGFTIFSGVSVGAMASLLKRLRPDVVHAHGARSFHSARSISAAKRLGFPVVFTPHCFYPAQNLSGKIKRALFDHTIGLHSLRCANVIISLTEQDRSDAISLGAEPTRIRIIPNSIDLPVRSATSQDSFRSKHGLERYLLSVGRIDPVKGCDFLISALRHLPADLKMVFIGPDAGHLSTCKKLTHELGLERRVVFAGNVDDEELVSAYGGAAAVVMASKYEGLPTVLLEGMALGVPVIAANTGGIRFVVTPRKTGFLYGYRDIDAYREAVTEVLTRPNSQMTAAAQVLVRNGYTWKVNLPKLFGVYEQCAATKLAVTA
jgi:glycosyltransferase involved in cell wall biosynthesis